MSIKRDYKTKTDDGMELEPLGGPKSPDKDKTNGAQFGEYIWILKSIWLKTTKDCCLNTYATETDTAKKKFIDCCQFLLKCYDVFK